MATTSASHLMVRVDRAARDGSVRGWLVLVVIVLVTTTAFVVGAYRAQARRHPTVDLQRTQAVLDSLSEPWLGLASSAPQTYGGCGGGCATLLRTYRVTSPATLGTVVHRLDGWAAANALGAESGTPTCSLAGSDGAPPRGQCDVQWENGQTADGLVSVTIWLRDPSVLLRPGYDERGDVVDATWRPYADAQVSALAVRVSAWDPRLPD